MDKLISVVVPVYNVEKYLKKCIDSTINQTYKKLEIILVDDGSTDSSKEICDEYIKQDSRIKVIHKENGGLSSARNAGIDIASGKYIGFIDSDDWIEKSMLEKLINLAEKSDSDIVLCNYFMAYDEKNQIQKEDIEYKEYSNYEALNKIYDDKLGVSMIIAWNKLYNIELFNNIRYPAGKVHEDEFITYKLLFKANRICYLNEKLVYYRQQNKSITNSKFNKKRLDILQAFEERANYIKNIVKDKELYKKTLTEYYGVIIRCYFKYKESYEGDKKTLKEMLKKARNIYIKNIFSFKWSLKLRVIYTTFIINPNIYKTIERISMCKKSI